MEIAVQEIIEYGVKRKYHKDGAGMSYSSKTAWLASFACWCLENSTPSFKSPHTAGSRLFINHSTLEPCEAFYGAIVVFSDCSKNGKTIENSGHVAFVFGELSSGTHLVLGGNQGNMIKISKYDCSGNVFYSHYSSKRKRNIYKIFRGFYKPKGYIITEEDYLNNSDIYTTPDEVNKKIRLGSVKTVSGEADD